MGMNIDQKTMAEILKLGGQYFLPAAALLRALYSGIRGKFPEGVLQIAGASVCAGLTAAVGSQEEPLRTVLLKVLGNTVFMAGLLAFMMTYLLRQPNRGRTFDGVVGGILGLVVWLVWVIILGNPGTWWMFPLFIAAGAAAFIVLRILLRQIVKLVRIATYLIITAIILILGAGGIMLLQTVTRGG
jgi:hypothetical protein